MRVKCLGSVVIGVTVVVSGICHANEEAVFELPGGVKAEFVWIEPGTFTMGDPQVGRRPHQVTLTKGFYLGKYELTQGQWESVMKTRPWSGQPHVKENDRSPAVFISWEDVQLFINNLNQAMGDSLYRLPTEAEWEYTCRAGTITEWSFGDSENLLGFYAWNYYNAWAAGGQFAQIVGTKKANPWGVFDMHDNVREWVQDWYGPSSDSSQVDPTGLANGSRRVTRGGGIQSYSTDMKSAAWFDLLPNSRDFDLGTRLVRAKAPVTAVAPQTWGQAKNGR